MVGSLGGCFFFLDEDSRQVELTSAVRAELNVQVFGLPHLTLGIAQFVLVRLEFSAEGLLRVQNHFNLVFEHPYVLIF